MLKKNGVLIDVKSILNKDLFSNTNISYWSYNLSMGKILVTGSSGFIGMHLCEKLLKMDYEVLGIDNMTSCYDVSLKEYRLLKLKKFKNFSFHKIDISDFKSLSNVFGLFKPEKVVNLAAQAGVRQSLVDPDTYLNFNVNGFLQILKCCNNYGVEGLIYASSSSVYGQNTKIPFSEKDKINDPISI